MPVSEQAIFSNLAPELLSNGISCIFVARGRSMAPFIADADSVVISPCGSSVRIGDVVLTRSDDHRLLLHRIISASDGGVVTRGDAYASADSLCTHENILGRAVKIAGKRNDMHLFFPFGYILVLLLRLRKYPRIFRPIRSIVLMIVAAVRSLRG